MAQTHETEPGYRLEKADAPRWYLSPKWVRVFLAGDGNVGILDLLVLLSNWG